MITQEGVNWLLYDDIKKDYLNCYVWLTTAQISDIGGNVDCPIVSFEYHVPENPAKELSKTYWTNYTWLCKSMIGISDFKEPTADKVKKYIKFNTHIPSLNYYHFKMVTISEQLVLKYPPIPEFFYNLYKVYKEDNNMYCG